MKDQGSGDAGRDANNSAPSPVGENAQGQYQQASLSGIISILRTGRFTEKRSDTHDRNSAVARAKFCLSKAHDGLTNSATLNFANQA
jgi:hypothetical protein